MVYKLSCVVLVEVLVKKKKALNTGPMKNLQYYHHGYSVMST